MIRKTIILLSIALCVLGDGHHAVSEQWIKIIHKEHAKEHQGHHGELSHIGSTKPEHHEEYAWSYPSYEFSYKVHDPHTHDMKGQEESRDGDEVKGEYWLVQPDGRKRTVKYHADKHSGFHATVHYEDDDHHHIEHHGDHDHEEDNKENKDDEEDKDHHKEEVKEVVEEVNEEGGNEEEGDESRGDEEVGKWIHDRLWGHRGNDRHHDKHHDNNKYGHRAEHKDHHDRPLYGNYHMVRGDEGHTHEEERRHKDMTIYSGLGSYDNHRGHKHAEWHGHDHRREKDEEESRGHPKHVELDSYPRHKAEPIVRENYYHPRFYRQSQHQRKNGKQ